MEMYSDFNTYYIKEDTYNIWIFEIDIHMYNGITKRCGVGAFEDDFIFAK